MTFKIRHKTQNAVPFVTKRYKRVFALLPEPIYPHKEDKCDTYVWLQYYWIEETYFRDDDWIVTTRSLTHPQTGK